MRKRRAYTPADNKALADGIAAGVPYRVLALQLDRTVGSLKGQAGKLGLSYSREHALANLRAGAVAAAAEPARRAELVALCRRNSSDPRTSEIRRQTGRRVAVTVLQRPDVRARNAAATAAATRALAAERMTWLPDRLRRRYTSLRSIHGAAAAKQMIIEAETARRAALSPFERLLEDARAGRVRLTERPVLSRSYDHMTLGGVASGAL